MSRQTQKQIVIDKLKEEGRVDNFWAFHNYILRLGAIIHGLREDGWEIDGRYGEGNHSKNFIYTWMNKKNELEPKKPVIRKHVNI